jgi:hypothetical protein
MNRVVGAMYSVFSIAFLSCSAEGGIAGEDHKRCNRRAFTYRDPCVQTDPHLGYNEAAATATRKAVKEFLRTTFKLG